MHTSLPGTACLGIAVAAYELRSPPDANHSNHLLNLQSRMRTSWQTNTRSSNTDVFYEQLSHATSLSDAQQLAAQALTAARNVVEARDVIGLAANDLGHMIKDKDLSLQVQKCLWLRICNLQIIAADAGC